MGSADGFRLSFCQKRKADDGLRLGLFDFRPDLLGLVPFPSRSPACGFPGGNPAAVPAVCIIWMRQMGIRQSIRQRMRLVRPTVAAYGATGSEDQPEKIHQNMVSFPKRKISSKNDADLKLSIFQTGDF